MIDRLSLFGTLMVHASVIFVFFATSTVTELLVVASWLPSLRAGTPFFSDSVLEDHHTVPSCPFSLA